MSIHVSLSPSVGFSFILSFDCEYVSIIPVFLRVYFTLEFKVSSSLGRNQTLNPMKKSRGGDDGTVSFVSVFELMKQLC